jgi:hypothetical protein
MSARNAETSLSRSFMAFRNRFQFKFIGCFVDAIITGRMALTDIKKETAKGSQRGG